MASVAGVLRRLVREFLSGGELAPRAVPVVYRGLEFVADIQAGALMGSPPCQLLSVGNGEATPRLPTVKAMLVASRANSVLASSAAGEGMDEDIPTRVEKYCRALGAMIEYQQLEKIPSPERLTVSQNLTELESFLESLIQRVLMPELDELQYQMTTA
ncbi:MAG: hypothetical protein ABIE42_06715 [Candidatus Eisenbacteria bacterium]